MDLATAEANINETAWYRPPSMPALALVRVRILSIGPRCVFVTTRLGIDEPVPKGEVIPADPDGLHFNAGAFDPF